MGKVKGRAAKRVEEKVSRKKGIAANYSLRVGNTHNLSPFGQPGKCLYDKAQSQLAKNRIILIAHETIYNFNFYHINFFFKIVPISARQSGHLS